MSNRLNQDLRVRVPECLAAAVLDEASRRYISTSAFIRSVLARELNVSPPQRRDRGRAA